MMGMSTQVLWQHHLYQPDRAYLEAKIYPVVREAALFYCSFAEKCPKDAAGKGEFGPSFSPEHGGFGVYNVPFDLAYARYTLQAAIAAAGELNCDKELARIPPGDRVAARLPDGARCEGQADRCRLDGLQVPSDTTAQHHRAGRTGLSGGASDVVSPAPQKQLFLNTLRQTRHRGCNSTSCSASPRRMSMPEAIGYFSADYYARLETPNGLFEWPMHGSCLTESVGIAAAISEFLLQSVDNTIRVFPCWPKEKDAAFTRLRAQGGILVSAEEKEGKIIRVEIVSTVGGPLRLLNPWTNQIRAP